MQDDDAVTWLRAPGDGKDSRSLSQVSASGDAEIRRTFCNGGVRNLCAFDPFAFVLSVRVEIGGYLGLCKIFDHVI